MLWLTENQVAVLRAIDSQALNESQFTDEENEIAMYLVDLGLVSVDYVSPFEVTSKYRITQQGIACLDEIAKEKRRYRQTFHLDVAALIISVVSVIITVVMNTLMR